MGRYSSDMNKVLGIQESGTYGSAMTGSSFWIGQVQSNSIDDKENKIETRYMGTSTRSVDTFDEGVRDVTGTVTYRAQDFRLPFLSIGSIYSVSGTNSVHTATEIGTDQAQSPFVSGALNPPISFTLEDSKQSPGTGRNFIRKINGCVLDRVSITATPSDVITVEADYIGQTLTYSSGTTTAVTEVTTNPYTFGNASLTLAGSSITAKEVTLEINQNVEAPHYLNGSRDIATPYFKNRDYMLSVTMDLDSTTAAMLYNQYYKSTSSFNGVFDLNGDSTTGSRHAIFTMSGCYITSMDNPSEIEGVTESTVEIRPKKISAQEFNRVAKYTPY